MGKKLILSVLVFWIGLQSYSQTSETRYILLAWDTSLSMENRVPEHDFKFLDNYFERNPELRVNVVLFSNTVYANHEFEIMKGDWSAIKAVLENVDYDGATNLHSVESIISLEHTELFLFTDGAQTFGTGVPDFGIKTFVVNSNPYKEQNDLNAILVNNKVRLFDYGRPIFSQPEVKNTSTIKKSETQIQEVKDTLSPGPGISLSEVVVSEDLRVENPIETVDIGNGTVDKNRVGVAVQSIGENEISPIQTNVAQSVQGRFSGVRVGVKPNNDLSQVKMRSDNSMLLNNYGLIVIDGIPQRQSISETLKDNGTSLNPRGVKSANHPMASMGHIDPDNVADITVLKGLAATTRFGTLGANGVILITTKTSKSGKTSGKPVDRARLKNNIYDGDLMVEKKSSVPSYIKDLMAISNLEQAYEHYLKQRIDHLADPQFFLDVHDYFKPLDNAIAQRILSNLAELNAKNLSSLRVLAYKYELEGDFKQYLKINQQILDLDENSAQVKFDLALSAEDNKKYHLAYNQLTGLLHNNSDGPRAQLFITGIHINHQVFVGLAQANHACGAQHV